MPYADHIPTYSHHKPSGQATVRLNGRYHYLGPYGTSAKRSLTVASLFWGLAGGFGACMGAECTDNGGLRVLAGVGMFAA